jgi:pilus assembly protein Flp/PilA
MKSSVEKIARFLRDESGPAAIEYAMLIGLIFLAVLTAITAVGQATSTSMETSEDRLQEALEAGP